LGKLFRASKVVYCFDNSSILIYEVLFCGCPVVVIPDGTQMKQDFEQLELGMDGIAWGDEQPPSPPNLPRLCARYAAVKHSFVEQLERMIASSQDRAARPVEWGQFESAEAIECKVERISIGQRLTQGVQHVDQFLRESERAIRKFRKRCVAYMRQQRKNEATPSRDSAAFFCADDDLSKRTLQCYSLDDNYRPTSAFDVNEAMPIPPTMPSGHLGILLRASRRFYCFSRNDPLIECALRCGCPVTLVDSFNRKREVLRLPLPPHRSSAAA
jgi:hypothetical protein